MAEPGGVLAHSHDHVVEFYEDDHEFVAAVARDLATELLGDAAVVVVATARHKPAVEEAIRAAGIDLPRLRAEGRYLSADAAEMLARFMVDGRPEPDRFHAVVGGMVAEAGRTGRRVRVFGEMVAVLWDEGNVTAAIELESLWNELGTQHDFFLHCAYPLASMATAGSLSAARRVCQLHSRVVAPAGYATHDRYSVEEAGANGAVDSCRFFVPVPVAVRAVRRFVRQTLEAWGQHDLVVDAELVASELVSNALLHADSPFRVSIAAVPSAIKISVHDADPTEPERRDVPAEATSGRGVAIVAGLSHRWGTDHTPDGKVVWVELASADQADT